MSAVLLGTTGCALFDDAARVAARSGADTVLTEGARLGDNLASQAPTRGATVRARIRVLSEDENVQDATYGLSWDVMCDVVTQSLPHSLEDVVRYVLAAAAGYGLAFTDEGAQELGDAIIDEIDGDESALREDCAALQP